MTRPAAKWLKYHHITPLFNTRSQQPLNNAFNTIDRIMNICRLHRKNLMVNLNYLEANSWICHKWFQSDHFCLRYVFRVEQNQSLALIYEVDISKGIIQKDPFIGLFLPFEWYLFWLNRPPKKDNFSMRHVF